MGFSIQEYWRGLPFPSLGDLPDPRIKLRVSCIAGRFVPVWAIRETQGNIGIHQLWVFILKVASCQGSTTGSQRCTGCRKDRRDEERGGRRNELFYFPFFCLQQPKPAWGSGVKGLEMEGPGSHRKKGRRNQRHKSQCVCGRWTYRKEQHPRDTEHTCSPPAPSAEFPLWKVDTYITGRKGAKAKPGLEGRFKHFPWSYSATETETMANSGQFKGRESRPPPSKRERIKGKLSPQ